MASREKTRAASQLHSVSQDWTGAEADQASWFEVDPFKINDVDTLPGMDKVQGMEEGPVGRRRRVEAAYEFGAVEHLDGEVGVDAALEFEGLNRRLSTCNHQKAFYALGLSRGLAHADPASGALRFLTEVSG